MVGEPENLMLVFLRRLDTKLDALGDRMGDIELRLTNLAQQVGSLSASLAALVATEAGHYASLSSRKDKIEKRMERVERRLDLIGPPAAGAPVSTAGMGRNGGGIDTIGNVGPASGRYRHAPGKG